MYIYKHKIHYYNLKSHQNQTKTFYYTSTTAIFSNIPAGKIMCSLCRRKVYALNTYHIVQENFLPDPSLKNFSYSGNFRLT